MEATRDGRPDASAAAAQTSAAGGATAPENRVRLQGRVSADPTERSLPSGDTIVVLRVVVARERTPMTAKSAQTVDVVDCVAWSARNRRTVARWREGDQVAVEGALRRRFYRAGAATMSRVEVEVLSGRLVSRSG